MQKAYRFAVEIAIDFVNELDGKLYGVGKKPNGAMKKWNEGISFSGTWRPTNMALHEFDNLLKADQRLEVWSNPGFFHSEDHF
jgi:hypothetical protein